MTFLALLLSVYFVSFNDKPATGTPALSPRALEQRAKWNIALDALDYPVSAVYLDSLRAVGATVHHSSRWMNGATCTLSDSLAEQVAGWAFVSSVEMTRGGVSEANAAYRKQRVMLDMLEDEPTPVSLASDRQQDVFNLRPLHEAGYRGQGILLTVCDNGFAGCDTASHLRREQELGHFDLTDDPDGIYDESGLHGAYCLSFISGITAEYEGAATEADYYLMRSEEYTTESPKEMDNLVAALEKADSLGTNIFTVSLGYARFDSTNWNLTYNMLDGQTTRASRAATIAARKGMLVCVAAGNEGNKDWHWLTVPADADSILTVGAVGVDSVIGAFSSFGPTADGRVKPEVCAVGVSAAYINEYGQVGHGKGTSFATPQIAGLAACLWSALPDENAMQIRERIIRSADRYNNPDPNQYGYGIPNAWAAYQDITTLTETPIEKTTAKFIRNGQLLIQKGDNIYTILGAPTQTKP